MRDSESNYWDKEANGRLSGNGSISDNIWKRQYLVANLLNAGMIDQRILEIGIGTATAIGAIQLAILGKFKYIGTDVSKKFVEHGKKWDLDVRHTDILNLPDINGGFTRVICLDTLEHVKPEDRQAGYQEINRVLAKHSKILLNVPVEETRHNLEFDHHFDIIDILQLAQTCNMSLKKYNPYVADLPKDIKMRYIWVELER